MTDAAKAGLLQFEREGIRVLSIGAPRKPEPERTQGNTSPESLKFGMSGVHRRDLIGVGPVNVPGFIPGAAFREEFGLCDGNAARFFYPRNVGISLARNGDNTVCQIRVIP
jgi:hypothetical protein